MIREADVKDLDGLLELYLHLHEESIPARDAHLQKTWEKIMGDENYHIVVCEIDGKIVSSCVCLIVPNLTHNVRPYALVENVVTDADHRGKGYATACLNRAREIAVSMNCYKIMLMTGSKKESTLRFYSNAGYNSGDKTAFIQKME